MIHKDKADVFGECIACNTSTVTLLGKRFQPNEHYKERKFKLSNNSIMRVAFCDKCVTEVKKKDFDWIMKNVISGWEASMNRKNKPNAYKQKYAKNYYHLKIKDFV